MRLFVAVTPPAAVLDEVGEAVAGCREKWPDLRWTPPERQHITLSFLGEVDDERLQSLTPGLERAASETQPLELRVAGAGTFPRARRARVLWMGLSGDRDPLIELASSVAAAARQADIPQEDRAFSPHLTLARARTPGDLRPLVEELSGFSGTPWTADAVHLVRSYLGPRPRYETVASCPLGAAPGR